MCCVYALYLGAGVGAFGPSPLLPRRRAEQDRTLRRLFAGILRISPSTHTHTGHTLQIAYKSCIISSWRRLKSCCVGAHFTYVGRRRVRGLPSAAVSILSARKVDFFVFQFHILCKGVHFGRLFCCLSQKVYFLYYTYLKCVSQQISLVKMCKNIEDV